MESCNVFLSTKNCHERDKHISFDEGPHIYTIKGKSDYESVTTWVHKQFEEFDADKIINNMMKNSEKWRLNKYYGMTKQEIIDMWNKNRDDAADAGTKLHYSIEYFYNHNENMIMKPNVETTTQDTMDHPRPEWLDDLICNSIEYEYFLNFHKDHQYLTPYRTEWMIYDEELKLAGSIDMVFEELDGSLSIYDWKRCKEIVKTSRYNKYSTNETINYLPDTNYWHYCLQLNIYKALLEKNYGVTIKHLYLVCLHSNNKNYVKISVVDLQEDVENLFKQRV